MRLRLIYVSPTSACQIFTGTYSRLHGYIVQPFGFFPTMASADFSQFVVTTADETACETSRDKSVFFPRLPSRFTHMGYGYLLGFIACGQFTHHVRLNIGFLFVGLRFRYLFFSSTPRDVNLESRLQVRR